MMDLEEDDVQARPVEVEVYKKRRKGGGVVLELKEPFVSVVVWPTSTVEELKRKVFGTAKKEGKVAPAVKSLKLYVQPLPSEHDDDNDSDSRIATAVESNVDPAGEFEELKNDQVIAGLINDDGQLQLTVFMMDKTWVQTLLDITLFAVYMGLNIGINLYNKWMFSVLNFRIPLFNLVVHQFSIFFVLLVFVLLRMCTGWGLKIIAVNCFKHKGRDFGLISALGVVGALNFGLTSVALMLLSQADLQIVRATIPFFVAVSFAILEGRKFSAVEIFFMLVTIVGVVIVVVFHAKTWHMDVTGLIIAVASNFAAALHMSLYALCKDVLQLDAWSTMFYTVVPLGAFVIPFVFITHEPANIEAFLKNGHSVIEVVRVLSAGTALALAYNWIHIEFIQRTTSVFVAVAGNFKIVILIILSELFVQDTHLPPWSIVGICIVVFSFLGSFSEREVQRRVKVVQKIKSCNPCGRCWAVLLKQVGFRSRVNCKECCNKHKDTDDVSHEQGSDDERQSLMSAHDQGSGPELDEYGNSAGVSDNDDGTLRHRRAL